MSRKTLLLILGSSFLGLVIVGIPLGLILTPPSGEPPFLFRYLPPEASMGLFVRLPVGEEAQAWSPLSDVLSEIPGFQMGMATFRKQTIFFPGTGIRLDRDIEPWLGSSLAVGVTGPRTGVESKATSLLLAVEVRDGQAFHTFLDRLRSELETIQTPLEESTYGRYTLFAVPSQRLYFALRDERVFLLSTELDALKAALEREEKDSLASNPDYRAWLGYLPSGGVLQVYISSEDVYVLQRQRVRAIAHTLLFEPEGLRAEFAAFINREAPVQGGVESLYWAAMAPNPEKALSFMPEESHLALSARIPGLDASWEEILSALRWSNRPTYLELQRGLEELKDRGLDVEKDLLPWIGEEIGFFLMLDPEGGIPLGEDGAFMRLGLVTEVKDQEKVRAGLQELESLLGREAGWTFSDREISGLTFRVSRVPEEANLTLGYALVDNFLLLAFDEASLRSLAQARADPGQRLSASEEFQAVLRHLPGSRTALLFLNLEGFWKALPTTLLAEARQYAEMWLLVAEHFRGLGIASAVIRPGDEVSTATLFLHIVR